MISIDYQKDYTLEEVVNGNLIQGVRSYPTLYNMVTELGDGVKRSLVKETTAEKIKPFSIGRPGAKKLEKLFINGKEISNFLNLHNIKHSFTL